MNTSALGEIFRGFAVFMRRRTGMKIAIYARVSSQNQAEGGTIEAQLGYSHYEALEKRDANRFQGVQALQRQLADCETGKKRVIDFIARGEISDADASEKLDEINAEIGRLHAELAHLETTRSLARVYIKRFEAAEKTINEVSKLPDSPENRRRAIEALLQKIEVKSSGAGRHKRAELTFFWLGQDPITTVSIEEVTHDAPRDGYVSGP
jgi:septal ring factor EnvC (AmiA/AmiB activator)